MQSNAKPSQSRGPSLRLFSGSESSAVRGKGISADLTLSEFYEKYVAREVLIHASPGTKELHRIALGYWEAITGGPPIYAIDRGTCSDFVAGLLEVETHSGEPISTGTVHKHCRSIQLILDRAGPEERRGRYGGLNAGLVDRVPALCKPSLSGGEVEDVFTLAELAELLRCCRSATAPDLSGISTAAWWESLLLVAYNTCLRIGALLSLAWSSLREDEYGHWISVHSSANKKKSQLVYLNCHALAAIRRIKADSELIFAFPHQRNWLHTQRRRILAASSLPSSRHFGFHAIRKLAVTELSKINPMAAKMAANHSSRDITKDHYTHRSLLAHALVQMPQPNWNQDDSKQRRLF